MRIVAISDTHGLYRELGTLPAGDLLIHSGDWVADSDYISTRDFLIWFGAQPHQHKVLVPGNHDLWVEANLPQFLTLLAQVAPDVTYLNDEGTDIEGLKVWGSGYTCRFYDWAFNVDRGPAIQAHWDLIPIDTDILISHGPPMGILDVTTYGKGGHYGCANLATTIRERLKSLKLVTFGHFHGPGGQTEIHDGVTYVNASVVNERYQLTNQPVVIDL